MSKERDHHHGHHHPGTGASLILATLLTLGFAAVEAGVGLWAGSLALVADAGHMFTVKELVQKASRYLA